VSDLETIDTPSILRFAERIYTTTYYIPSSPTEVRAYTPVLSDHMRMIADTNTVKLCATGFERHPTGVELHRSFGKAVEETCSAASGAVGRLQMHTT
jgi:hypothetical protein